MWKVSPAWWSRFAAILLACAPALLPLPALAQIEAIDECVLMKPAP